MMVSSREKGVEMQDYMINWNVGPLGLVLRPDLGTDMPPVVSQVLPGESVASLAGVAVGDMLVSLNGKKASKLGYEKAMKLLYKQKLPMILHFRIPQFKTVAANDAALYYGHQQTPTGGSSSLSMTPLSARHATGTANTNANGNGNPYQSSSLSSLPAQPSYPGQFVQYNQQQHHQQYHQFQHQQPYQHQQQQHQHQQTQYHDQSYQQHQHQPPSPFHDQHYQLSQSQRQHGASTRGVRSLSVLSTSTATKEQKLRKQFSVVWESGSLGFSFRPYAPGVNIPTVDLIGARGDGKNMDQVCINDVLIAINGENTKSLGVERVLKMLHVLEKPVVLRFHKSSHRIENLQTATRTRQKSSAKLPAVVEKEQEQEQGEEEDEEEEEGQEEGEKAVEEDGAMRQEEGVASVRFADQIQLRSEHRDEAASPPPPPPPPPPLHTATPPSTPEPVAKLYASRRSVPPDHAANGGSDPAATTPVPVADNFAARMAGSAHAPTPREHQHQHLSHSQSRRMSPSHKQETQYTPPPPPPPMAPTPILLNQSVHVTSPSKQESSEPDEDAHHHQEQDVAEIDESKLPPVPISIVGSVPPKKASSSFVIPLEHAREIVAKSSGKPVEQCEFGGLPLPQIREGSVQARLLVTFAKACLAKQMKQLRGEVNGPLVKPLGKSDASQQAPPSQTPPQSSSPHSSENRSSIANAGSTYVPSNASSYAGNSYGPSKSKMLTYSFHNSERERDTTTPTAPATISPPSTHPEGQESVLSNSQLTAENDVLERYQSTIALRGTHLSSGGLSLDSADDRARSSEGTLRRHADLSEPNGTRATPPTATPLQRASETERPSNGGLTLSQLRVSEKRTGAGSLESDLHSMLKDLNTPPEHSGALPKRVTEMISIDTLLIDDETKETEPPMAPEAAVEVASSPVTEMADDAEVALMPVEHEVAAAEGADQEETGKTEETTRSTIDLSAAASSTPYSIEDVEANLARRKLSTPAFSDHPVIQNLCVGSRDLELVMVGRDVDMILCKTEVVEEIQDILDSLEMELQFERHSHVGFGRGSIVDEPPVRSCSRCGKNGDIADLALDSERRELYCQNCWDVFFYHKHAAAMGSPRSSRGRIVPPEFDTPTDFDPYEYSLHDSMVNVADEFHPWRHLHFDDSSSERDSDMSNMTLASTITSHADEVWL